MVSQYSVDFKLKIVKMILNEQITKHEIERTHKAAPNVSATPDLLRN